MFFYQFYLCVKFFKNTLNPNIFRELKFGSILLITFFEVLNFLTLSKYFRHTESMKIGKYNIELILSMLFIAGLNYYYLARGNKFDETVRNVSQLPKNKLYIVQIATIFYAIVSFYFIWYVQTLT